ncbi:hypothetical protein [Flaviaesturariibacter amylovorans]|uniref:Energy transducer TonB n=1 Tax=Flaviaesturariibacter amylovorans TaxID=1084520 RepID=A0ABP8GRR3_9BACT
MKKAVAIFLLLLLCVQAIPVAHWLEAADGVLFTCVDEDKPGEPEAKAKKVVKEYLAAAPAPVVFTDCPLPWARLVVRFNPPPDLDTHTPPPDRAC